MKKRVDKVIVIWTANSEIYMLTVFEDISPLKTKVDCNSSMPASVIFCIAAIEE